MNEGFRDNEVKRIEEDLASLVPQLAQVHSDFREAAAAGCGSAQNLADRYERHELLHALGLVERSKAMLREALEGLSALRARRG